MAHVLIGAKLKARRKSLGITQAGLAQRLGISASYLNLIEGNRRNIGGALLKRVADALAVPVEQFDGAAERRLLEELGDVALEPLLAPLGLAGATAAGLASQHGAWARALVSLHRAYRDRCETVDALTDRLNQDPVLAEAVHSLLTHVTAIRSAAEILEGDDALDVSQRTRFVSMIGSECRRLSALSQGLMAFFTQDNTVTRPILPAQEVDDFLVERANHFPRLELAAEELRLALGLQRGQHASGVLAAHLQQVHGVRLQSLSIGAPMDQVAFEGRAGGPWFEPQARVLVLPDDLPESTRAFELARLLFGLAAGAPIGAEVAATTALTTERSRQQALRALQAYGAAALLMPYGAFHDAARHLRYDIERLARAFHASIEQVCHRLITLRRPGAEGLRFGFMRADPSGHLSKRFALPGLALPRDGTACPLWPVYRAFQTPGVVLRERVEFPGGDRYLMWACVVDKGAAGFAVPRQRVSLMLVCDELHADQLVYGDGLDRSGDAPHTPVGPACRICVRRDCRWRQQAPVIDPDALRGLPAGAAPRASG